jgi:hypothetical protein
MDARRSRVNDTLGDSLVIEMGDFFPQDEILQKRRAARIGPERVLIVGKRDALVRGERGVISAGDLVPFAAGGQLPASLGDGTLFLFAVSGMTRHFSVHDRSP